MIICKIKCQVPRSSLTSGLFALGFYSNTGNYDLLMNSGMTIVVRLLLSKSYIRMLFASPL